MTSAADLYRIQAYGCRAGASKSPFYATILDALAVDADANGPSATAIASVAHLGMAAAIPLRLLGGVHRAVLAGAAPSLVAHFPSVGGDGDAVRAAAKIIELLHNPPAAVTDALARDPQTNEVGRAAALAVGLDRIARAAGPAVRLIEVGASAGLNLRLDSYGYAHDRPAVPATGRVPGGAGATGWGDPSSPVQFAATDFTGAPDPFGHGCEIVERRGCDRNPIDATTDDGALALLGYVWPDQHERSGRLRAAIEVARRVPVVLERALADDFVDEHVTPTAGVTTVLMHSIMWQYLPAPAQQRIERLVADRSSTASATAPLAWLRFEPNPDGTHPVTTVQVWPQAPDPRAVATSTFHGPPVVVR